MLWSWYRCSDQQWTRWHSTSDSHPSKIFPFNCAWLGLGCPNQGYFPNSGFIDVFTVQRQLKLTKIPSVLAKTRATLTQKLALIVITFPECTCNHDHRSPTLKFKRLESWHLSCLLLLLGVFKPTQAMIQRAYSAEAKGWTLGTEAVFGYLGSETFMGICNLEPPLVSFASRITFVAQGSNGRSEEVTRASMPSFHRLITPKPK